MVQDRRARDFSAFSLMVLLSALGDSSRSHQAQCCRCFSGDADGDPLDSRERAAARLGAGAAASVCACCFWASR